MDSAILWIANIGKGSVVYLVFGFGKFKVDQLLGLCRIEIRVTLFRVKGTCENSAWIIFLCKLFTLAGFFAICAWNPGIISPNHLTGSCIYEG